MQDRGTRSGRDLGRVVRGSVDHDHHRHARCHPLDIIDHPTDPGTLVAGRG